MTMKKLFLFAAALLVGPAAYAQNPPPPPANGPLVLERIHDGWIVAPDFKVTDLDDRTGELAGAYGGRLFDNTLLVGGAGYWLTNDARDFQMAYGGVIVGWQSREFGRIRFGGRGLAGGGRATLGFDITQLSSRPINVQPRNVTITGPNGGTIRFGGGVDPRVQIQRAPVPQLQARPGRVLAREDFAVFEPQGNISARITKAIGVSCGIGYRETAGADFLGDRLNGPTANLAIQFGW
jgi:hypothetical protein